MVGISASYPMKGNVTLNNWRIAYKHYMHSCDMGIKSFKNIF